MCTHLGRPMHTLFTLLASHYSCSHSQNLTCILQLFHL